MQIMTKSQRAAYALFATLLTVSLSACAEESRTEPPQPSRDLMPFSIGFDLKGDPVLLDEKGNRIPPTDVQFPIKATAIESVESITLVQYRGSHVKLIKTSGGWFTVPLPH